MIANPLCGFWIDSYVGQVLTFYIRAVIFFVSFSWYIMVDIWSFNKCTSIFGKYDQFY